MWQKLILQVIAYGILLLFIIYKVFMPVIRFRMSVRKIIEINNKIKVIMDENPYLVTGGIVSKERSQKDCGLLLDYSYEMKDELKKAFGYYEEIPFFIAKLFRINTVSIQLYQLLDAINKAIWKVRCNL